jgi:hypothetical protein
LNSFTTAALLLLQKRTVLPKILQASADSGQATVVWEEEGEDTSVSYFALIYV